jgi:glycosyltransferase involved in cell wall biosynthesis
VKLRIAHVTATFPPYEAGTGRVCYYNAVELAKLGHQVTVYTSETDALHAPDQPAVDAADFASRRLPAVFRVGNAPLLPGLLGLRGVDLIHLHWPFIFGAELVWLASLRTGIPYVITYHNDLIGDGFKGVQFKLYLAVVAPLVFSRARKLLAVTLDHAANSRLAPLFKRHWSKVAEMPNGVDTAHFRPMPAQRERLRVAYGIPPGACVALFVGALDAAHHYRRVDLLIDACATLGRPDLHLVIVGEGDRRAQYEAQARASGLEDRAHFLGRLGHDRLPEVYNAADVVVLPSQLQESFGMVLIEGMACGIPAIASTLPGVRMVVNDGEDGLLIEPGNVATLAAALKSLLDDAERRQRMGRAGRAKVEAKYAWPAIGQSLDAIYRGVLARDA